jgi:pyridoxamine 5'-phosphate oxidase
VIFANCAEALAFDAHRSRAYKAPVATDPIQRFRRWYAEAPKAGVPLPEAMALATADRRGRPSVRFVLLKGVEDDGFVFFTNFESRKGRELEENPWASLAWYWDVTGKQVRVEGKVTEVSAADADAYWLERPLESRFASTASDQSRPVETRAELLAKYRELEKDFPDGDVPRPRRWSGLCVVPESIEFWTRAEPRLHRRELFTRSKDGWKSKILQP